MKRFQRLLQGEDGATAVEYAVMLACIILVCIGAITLVGGGTFNYWQNNRSELESAFSGS
jgi:pilus assembly protein Flp/PilA